MPSLIQKHSHVKGQRSNHHIFKFQPNPSWAKKRPNRYTSFSVAEKNLSLKASRALFLIQHRVFEKALLPFAVMHIFDSLAKPVALYGSEVWAAYKKKTRKKQTITGNDT